LTGSRLTASLMWAQGSCELPTAKPRMRRLSAPLRGALLVYPHTRPPFQTTNAQAGFQATRLDTNQLQTIDNSLVANRLLRWYPRALLPTSVQDTLRWLTGSEAEQGGGVRSGPREQDVPGVKSNIRYTYKNEWSLRSTDGPRCPKFTVTARNFVGLSALGIRVTFHERTSSWRFTCLHRLIRSLASVSRLCASIVSET
jgi:hypothetical protein